MEQTQKKVLVQVSLSQYQIFIAFGALAAEYDRLRKEGNKNAEELLPLMNAIDNAGDQMSRCSV